MSENRSTTQPTGAGVFAVAELKRRMAEREAGEQIWLTDRDACSMATSGRGSGVVGYNVQTAVDTNHQLIVTHEVRSGSLRHPHPDGNVFRVNFPVG